MFRSGFGRTRAEAMSDEPEGNRPAIPDRRGRVSRASGPLGHACPRLGRRCGDGLGSVRFPGPDRFRRTLRAEGEGGSSGWPPSSGFVETLARHGWWKRVFNLFPVSVGWIRTSDTRMKDPVLLPVELPRSEAASFRSHVRNTPGRSPGGEAGAPLGPRHRTTTRRF